MTRMSRTSIRIVLTMLSLAFVNGFFLQPTQAQQITSLEQLPLYAGKAAAQWIGVLKTSPDAKERASAAEALGFMARSGRMTYGGFSDVPIDSEEPPKLTAEQIKPITDALIEALADPERDVRAAAAIGIAWIGPRARSAIPALIPLIEEAADQSWQADPGYSAMTALGTLGPDADDAIPHLQRLMLRNDPRLWVKVAGTLRELDAPPDLYVPKMIETLAIEDRNHYAAMELAQLGDPAVPALLEALKSPNPTRRANAAYCLANMAGWENLTQRKEEVVLALAELTNETDHSVLRHATQALGSIHSVPEISLPTLIGLLEHEDLQVANKAAESLREFGADAKVALPALIDILRNDTGESMWSTAQTIREIGIDQTSAEELSTISLGDNSIWLLAPMCEFPDAALEFLKRNPQSAAVWANDRERLIEIMSGSEPQLEALRTALFASKHLTPTLIAQLRDPRLLPTLESQLAKADGYLRTKLLSAAIACGRKPERTIEISESQPSDFKPASAWPGTDSTRMAKEMTGHGDGYTEVIITGKILQADGTPAVKPKFFRTNDAMLLGQQLNDEIPFQYDEETGQFVFVTTVFAAYSSGGEQPQPGPYQTGSSMIQIEAAGSKSLVVHFYDEMPNVRITLSNAAEDK